MNIPWLAMLLSALLLSACHDQEVAASAKELPKPMHRRESTVIRSPDGKLEAFICSTPDRHFPDHGAWIVDGNYNGVEATELWISKPGGADARLLMRGGAESYGLRSPRFSPDGQHLYFLSCGFSYTAYRVHCMDLKTGKVTVITFGSSLDVILRGDYAGHLVVTQHRYFLGGGSYDWPWLMTPEGKALTPIASDANGEIHMQTWNSFLGGPPQRPESAVPQPTETLPELKFDSLRSLLDTGVKGK